MDYYRCSSCGTENEDYIKYCKKCGAWLLGDAKKIEKVSVAKRITTLIGKLMFVAVVILMVIGAISYFKSGGVETTASHTSSRSEPAKLGETLHFDIKHKEKKYNISLIIADLYRGEDLLQSMLGGQGFNPSLEKGYEYLLVGGAVRVNESENDNIPLSVDPVSFRLVSTDGVAYPIPLLVYPNALKGQIYEGAEVNGWLLFEVRQDDEKPMLQAFQSVWYELK